MIKMNDFLRSATYLAKATLREKSFTFWVLLFPLLLATFYHVALSNVFTFKVESIPVAVQEESFEKATLFCTIFIKCFLLSGHSLSDGCLIIETTVNAMMIPPVDIVLGFKG